MDDFRFPANTTVMTRRTVATGCYLVSFQVRSSGSAVEPDILRSLPTRCQGTRCESKLISPSSADNHREIIRHDRASGREKAVSPRKPSRDRPSAKKFSEKSALR
jgi:hypothetical protein